MRGSAGVGGGGLEKLFAGVSGLVKKRLDCTVPLLRKIDIKVLRGKHLPLQITAEDFFFKLCVKYIVHVY